MVQVPLGISTAVSVRVGNELGAGNPKGAKRAAYVSCGVVSELIIIHCFSYRLYYIIVVNAVITIAVVEVSRDHIGKLYNVTE